MDFDLNEEQRSIRTAAEEFAKGEFDKDLILECEKTHGFPRDILKKACQLGFVGIHYPEEYGGQGYGVLENTLIIEALCRQDSGMGIAFSCAESSAEMILRFGSDDQKRKYLPELLEARRSAAAPSPSLITEVILRASVRRQRGKGRVRHQRLKNLYHERTYLRLSGRPLPDRPAGRPIHEGQSVFMVEKGSPGFATSDVGEKMGNKMVSTGELSFNDVRVERSALVGHENKGFFQALHLFEELRIEVAAQAVGIAQGAFDRALAYVKERKQFGKKLQEFQVTRHKLADMAIRIETARLIVYKAAWSFDQGPRPVSHVHREVLCGPCCRGGCR